MLANRISINFINVTLAMESIDEDFGFTKMVYYQPNGPSTIRRAFTGSRLPVIVAFDGDYWYVHAWYVRNIFRFISVSTHKNTNKI